MEVAFPEQQRRVRRALLARIRQETAAVNAGRRPEIDEDDVATHRCFCCNGRVLSHGVASPKTGIFPSPDNPPASPVRCGAIGARGACRSVFPYLYPEPVA